MTDPTHQEDSKIDKALGEDWPVKGERVEKLTRYTRPEDMSSDGMLAIFMEDDGDIIVTAIGRDRLGDPVMAEVQFCTVGSGGGHSPKTREALRALMLAIAEDNGGKPSHE